MAPRAPAKRNYKKEYANYHSTPAQKKNRASRNAARAVAKKNGANVAGKDVAHRNGNPRDNRFCHRSLRGWKVDTLKIDWWARIPN